MLIKQIIILEKSRDQPAYFYLFCSHKSETLVDFILISVGVHARVCAVCVYVCGINFYF